MACPRGAATDDSLSFGFATSRHTGQLRGYESNDTMLINGLAVHCNWTDVSEDWLI